MHVDSKHRPSAEELAAALDLGIEAKHEGIAVSWLAERVLAAYERSELEPRALEALRDHIGRLSRALAAHDTGPAGETPPAMLQHGEIRHDLHGWYYCTAAEARHEDCGNPSVGFDLRPHFSSETAALQRGLDIESGRETNR